MSCVRGPGSRFEDEDSGCRSHSNMIEYEVRAIEHNCSVVKLLGIVLRNRCWPTTFHIITVGDVDGWCLNSPV